MIFFSTLSSVTILGVMVVIGVMFKYIYSITYEVRRVLIGLIINVGLPMIIISSIFNYTFDEDTLFLLSRILLLTISLHFIGLVSSRFILLTMGIPKYHANEIAVTGILGNTGFVGLPLCAILFGAKGALLAAVFDVGLSLSVWTGAVYLLGQGEKKFSLSSLKRMINVPLMATLTGIILGGLQFEAPQFIKQLSLTLAAIASPLAMIYIGMLFPTSFSALKTVNYSYLFLGILLKLILYPLLALVLVVAFSLDAFSAKVVIIQASVPTFSMASVLFDWTNRNVNFAIFMTILTVVVSLITIPTMIYLTSLWMGW